MARAGPTRDTTQPGDVPPGGAEGAAATRRARQQDGKAGSRRPLQHRSQASARRMLAAARALMVARANEDFTLAEVSRLGQVSIGSIYLRHESKEHLIRAVISDELAGLAALEEQAFAEVVRRSADLGAFVPAYVGSFAALLHDHALMLKLAIQRATTDADVSRTGSARADASAAVLSQMLQRYRAEIAGDPDRKAAACFDALFSTLVRRLSQPAPRRGDGEWQLLIAELSAMVLAYLRHAP